MGEAFPRSYWFQIFAVICLWTLVVVRVILELNNLWKGAKMLEMDS
jgi:hypothetical protein